MGETTVRSAWSSERERMRPGSPVEARSQWSSPSRADGGHLVRSPGKGPAVRRDNCNERVAGENWSAIPDMR